MGTLLDLQRSGLRVNIHLGGLFGAGFSRQVLSRIIPSRIGHGVLLLDDAETVNPVTAVAGDGPTLAATNPSMGAIRARSR